MSDIPVKNNTKNPWHVGGFMIPPGETRHLPEHHVPPHLRAQPVEAPPEAEDEDTERRQAAEAVLAHKIPEIVKLLPTMSGEELALLEAQENSSEKPRKGLLEAIAEERLRRASDSQDGEQSPAAKEAEEFAKLAAEMSDEELAQELQDTEDEGLRAILEAEVQKRKDASGG